MRAYTVTARIDSAKEDTVAEVFRFRSTSRRAAVLAAVALAAAPLVPAASASPQDTGGVVEWGFSNYILGPPPEASDGMTAVSMGGMDAMGLREGRVLVWGDNNFGQTEVPEAAASGVSAISAGWAHELALKNGGVLAWGNNWYGQTDVPSDAKSGVVAISTSAMHNLALKAGGRVISWGLRSDVPAAATSGVTAVSAGGDHSLAIKDGGVLAWGSDDHGQIDVPADAKSGVTAISAGHQHSLALKDGRVIAWGRNDSHQAEVPEAALSDVIAIEAGWTFNFALKSNGDYVTWGSNDVLEGDPVGWGLCGPFLAVSAGDRFTVALKADPSAPC
jgi:alpha-tubulin suppressor-like RCC1 family protein